MGKRPRTRNDMIGPGDKMPLSESSLANSLPALTKTIVAGSIPSCETQKNVTIGSLVNPTTRFITKNGIAGINRRVKR